MCDQGSFVRTACRVRRGDHIPAVPDLVYASCCRYKALERPPQDMTSRGPPLADIAVQVRVARGALDRSRPLTSAMVCAMSGAQVKGLPFMVHDREIRDLFSGLPVRVRCAWVGGVHGATLTLR